MLRIVIGAMVMVMSVPSFAEQPSYSYINGHFQTVDLDDGLGPDVDGDGFGIGGSYEVAENWHIVGSD